MTLEEQIANKQSELEELKERLRKSHRYNVADIDYVEDGNGRKVAHASTHDDAERIAAALNAYKQREETPQGPDKVDERDLADGLVPVSVWEVDGMIFVLRHSAKLGWALVKKSCDHIAMPQLVKGGDTWSWWAETAIGAFGDVAFRKCRMVSSPQQPKHIAVPVGSRAWAVHEMEQAEKKRPCAPAVLDSDGDAWRLLNGRFEYLGEFGDWHENNDGMPMSKYATGWTPAEPEE